MEELIQRAIDARRFSYSPYSKYAVGAALECADGTVYTGCNIENAAYTPTNCAERTVFFKAISEGKRDFKRIAIVGGRGDKLNYANPCGVCRQVMAEFCVPEFEIIVAKGITDYVSYSLCDMLPESFGAGNIV